MVFGSQQNLRNEIEGLREEKDFFRSKYLEQVSEIAALRESLEQSNKEIQRLRQELMQVAGVGGGTTVKIKTSSSPGKKKGKKKKVRSLSSRSQLKDKEEEKKDDYLNDGEGDGVHNDETITGRSHHDADETISNLSADDDEDDDDQCRHRRVAPNNDDDEQSSEDEDGDSSENDDDDDDEEDAAAETTEDQDEQAAIRHKAEQLVRWASYRRDKLSPSSSLSNKS